MKEGNRERKRRGLAWIGWDECSRLHTALDIVEIPDFVQLVGVLALNNSSDTSWCFQRRQNSRRCVRRCGRRHDTRVREPGIRRECLEQSHHRIEEIHNLFLWGVTGVAVRLQGTDACAMFPPFMLPESLICTRVTDPVCIHVGEEGSLAGGGQDGGDIGVGARRIAVGIKGSITMVWPIPCQK